MQKNLSKLRCVLFDLDGTLADTAPDLIAAVNLQRQQRDMPALPFSQLRPFASQGARGLIGEAFNVSPNENGYPALLAEFLKNYEQALCVYTVLFHGVEALLNNLSQRGYTWGIVTNKAERLAHPLIKQLRLNPAVIVCGDTTPHSKPHPAPLLHATTIIQQHPEECLYVGDDLRDIEAGKAAKMVTVAAAYGYCEQNIEKWEADFTINKPLELIELIDIDKNDK